MTPVRDPGPEAVPPEPLPTADDVRQAAERLAGCAVETPLLRADALDERIGGRLLLKAEPLQRTGSFKFRGAYNRVSRLDTGSGAGAGSGGVVAYSSGNHAQAVAAAARLVGVPAVIVMPRDAPAVKIAGTRRHGAEVVLYDRRSEAREALGARIAAERGAVLVKPYDDFYVIAGQGTVGREIVRQCAAIGCRPDAVIVPAGGGGLMAGTALAVADAWPGTRLHTAEPQGYHDHAMSLERGRRTGVPGAGPKSFCDALLAPMPGALTFPDQRRPGAERRRRERRGSRRSHARRVPPSQAGGRARWRGRACGGARRQDRDRRAHGRGGSLRRQCRPRHLRSGPGPGRPCRRLSAWDRAPRREAGSRRR